MPDVTSGYPRSYDYNHPNQLRARGEAAARSRGHCQSCGQLEATEAHHWAPVYPRAEDVTADDLTMVCWVCHDTTHDFIFFRNAGGSPTQFRTIVSEAVAEWLVRRGGMDIRSDMLRVGRPRRLAEDEWGALVSGGSRPRRGEVVRLFLRSKLKWCDVVVTDVVGGRPGCWLVRKQWRDVELAAA